MLDTLMVLWTRGLCSRFLQALATFLCLFIGICVMLFLITASGVKWPGLAVTVTPVSSLPLSAPSQVKPGLTATPYMLPTIQQNPSGHPATKRLATPAIPYYTRHPSIPAPAPTENTLLLPTPTPTPTVQGFLVPPFLPPFLP